MKTKPLSPPLPNHGAVAKHKPSDCYVVAGGPSAKGFDLERLRGRFVIVINDGMLSLPWASAVVTVDQRWTTHRWLELSQFAGEKYLVMQRPQSLWIPGAKWIEPAYEPGLSERQDVVHVRGNSGYTALGVAYLTWARRIHLIGFDMRDRDAHWYVNGLPWKSGASETMYERWAAEFDICKPQLDKAGIEIFDYSERGRITCFEKRSLDMLCSP